MAKCSLATYCHRFLRLLQWRHDAQIAYTFHAHFEVYARNTTCHLCLALVWRLWFEAAYMHDSRGMLAYKKEGSEPA
jgi:hypothetical protein